MKNILLLSFLMLSVYALPPGGSFAGGKTATTTTNASSAAAGGATYLVKQDLEGTGYDNSETWTESGTADEDYATAPAPLVGSQSLRMSGTTERDSSPSFAGQSTVWVYFQFNVTTLPSSGNSTFGLFIGPSVGVEVTSAGVIRTWSGSVNGSFTSDAITAGVTYHGRFRYTAGSGANAVGTFEFNTSATFTGSGNKFSSFTNGSETQNCTQLQLRAEGTQTMTIIFDKIRVDDVIIGDNPT